MADSIWEQHKCPYDTWNYTSIEDIEKMMKKHEEKKTDADRFKEKCDSVFFAAIKEFNNRDYHGSMIIPVSDDFAILIFWRKMTWTYEIHPFRSSDFYS